MLQDDIAMALSFDFQLLLPKLLLKGRNSVPALFYELIILINYPLF